jgi:predicted adenine nucleotide alpha hydrolase (AANH) superfamily ATPase
VDYIPVQVEKDFVQFFYNADYLPAKKWQKTIPDVDKILENISITPVKTNIYRLFPERFYVSVRHFSSTIRLM